MKYLGEVIGILVLCLLAMFLFDPASLGGAVGKVVSGYQSAVDGAAE